jgi:ribosome-associated protein
MDGVLRVTPTCAIRLDEIDYRTTPSGGPGGQHANTSDTKVEVSLRIDDATSLGPRQRERLRARFGPVVRATASDSRSQARNRELALERLRSRLAEGLRVERARVVTRPSRSAREERLRAKRRNAERKRNRRPPDESA